MPARNVHDGKWVSGARQRGKMFALLIFDCTFADLLTTKHRPKSLVKEKFDFSSAAWPME